MKYEPLKINDVAFHKHCKSLRNRIWQLLPLKEEKCETLSENISRLNRELNGLIKIANSKEDRIVTVMCLLENLKTETDFKVYKTDVFRCCDILNNIGGD